MEREGVGMMNGLGRERRRVEVGGKMGGRKKID